MLRKIILHLPSSLRNADSWILFLKRIIHVACFTGLCMIDQIIGSATGRIQYGLKNYTGIIIAIIILTAYKLKDFIKIPYFIWVIVFFIGRYFALDWGKANAGNYREFQTNLWGIGIYGIVIIRMFYCWVVEKKKPHMKWGPFCICMVMLISMAVIQNGLAWPKALLGALLCFYLTDFEEKDLNNLYSGMAEGIIVGFFIIQGQAWMYRPYDSANMRYLGMYSHPSMNALFYVCAYCAVLCKWYLMKLKKQHIVFRFPFILLAGVIIGTTVFTGARTAMIVLGIITVLFLFFQMLSRRKWKIVELIIDGILLVVSIVVCFLPSYYMIRYIPAYVDEPIYFESDNEDEKIQKGDPIDSEKYVELEEALERMYDRFSWFFKELDARKDVRIDWKDIVLPPMKVQAASDEWYEAFYNPEDEVYIEPGTDKKHPLLTIEEAESDVTIRVSIYKYFLNHLSLIGEKGNKQGVWLTKRYYATHCHNVLLQFAYDFGIIIALFFVAVVFMLYNRVLFGLTEKKSGAWYYRLFVTVSFATLFLAFGTLDIVWTYGQLPFIMFWVVQYIVYHKQPHEVEAEEMLALEEDSEAEQEVEVEEFKIEDLD